MKKLFSTVAVAAALSSASAASPDALYVNYGYVINAPQIDATAVLNLGVFDLFTTLPFSTQNTLNFTNRGVMYGTPGWRLDYASPTARRPLANFVNDGIMEGVDFGSFVTLPGDNGGTQIVSGGLPISFLTVEATNITSRGLLSVGSGGLLRLKAHNAELKRAGLRSGASPSGGSGSTDVIINGGTNYQNAAGVQDIHWGVGINQAFAPMREAPLNVANRQLNTPLPLGPSHEVRSDLGNTMNFFRSQVPILGSSNTNIYSAFVFTNSVSSSNITIQVVFVTTNLNNGEVTTDVRFGPGGNGAMIPMVRVGTRAFDTVLNRSTTNYVTISDTMLTRSNLFLSINSDGASARPVNYQVSTATPVGWDTMSAGNTSFNFNNHIFSFQWDSRVVTNAYSGYSFTVNRDPTIDLSVLYPGLPTRGLNVQNQYAPDLNNPTNKQGRVELESSGILNLEGTRMRAEQYLKIKSPDILLSSGTIMDAPFLNLDLGSPSGSLEIDGQIPNTVDRISGQFYLWSGHWTNQQVVFDFSNPQNVTSNTVSIRQHVLIVDNTLVQRTVPVTVADFRATADNLYIGDTKRIRNSFIADGNVVELGGNLTIESLSDTNFPRVVELHNFGAVETFTSTELGRNSATGLGVFGNYGFWYSPYQRIRAETFGNGSFGILLAYYGALELEGGLGVFEPFSTTISNGDISLNFETLSLRSASINAGDEGSIGVVGGTFPGRLYLTVTDLVDDGGNGPGSGVINSMSTTDGFELTTVPLAGDFHATRITSYAPIFGEVTHKWAGRDLGADSDGYFNNAALRSLRLEAGAFTLHTFETTDGQNALYVTSLELVGFPDDLVNELSDYLDIQPGMRIYFSNSNRNVNQLNGLLGGRLVHLPIPSGSTSVVTLANGQTLTIGNELLYSTTIDSDADGIPNAFDESPFDDIKLKIAMKDGADSKAILSWPTAPLTSYELQYRDGVDSGAWKTLKKVLTYGELRETVVEDESPAGSDRYYRVIYNP